MNNEEKAKEILNCENCKKQLFIGGVKCPPTCADYNDLMQMAQWKDEQIKQFKNYADKMFEAAQNLSTDASRLRKAMQEYKQFRDDYNYEHNTTKKD